ncbi:hypothetical protein L1049_012157 [Liquidambar formosana]|uniref:NAB domain-containing protein n=1 Tax=Liquidambar formosana TaxID=63359 RepID=A0AAP0RSN3_LIQFO
MKEKRRQHDAPDLGVGFSFNFQKQVRCCVSPIHSLIINLFSLSTLQTPLCLLIHYTFNHSFQFSLPKTLGSSLRHQAGFPFHLSAFFISDSSRGLLEANMKRAELKNSHSWWLDSHISPKSSKWVAENLQEVDQSVKHMLKLIEEDGDHSARQAEMYYQKRPELIAHVEGFYRMYQSLAQRYDHLTGELRKNISSGLQMQGSSEPCSEPATIFLTPDQKLGVRKSRRQHVGFDMHLSSGGGSSDLSLREGTESSSSSVSSDSESESFNSSINNYLSPPVNGDGEGLHQVIIDLETELPKMKENVGSMLKEGEKGIYEELLGRITDYEEELRAVNLKLQFSEEEVARLKCELEKNGSLTGNLQARLDLAQKNIEMREADLELEKGRVLQLQKQITELETQASDSDQKIWLLVEELKVNREKLKGSEEEITKLKHELANEFSVDTHQLQGQLELAQKNIAMLEAELDLERRQVSELQGRIVRYIADVSDREHEVWELNVALCDAQNNFSLEKAQLQSDVSSLSEEKTLLESRLKEWELRSKSLEYDIRQSEAEKMEMINLHETRESGLQGEIKLLKVQQAERDDLVEALNKNLDMLKLKYDTLVAEKDEANAKVHALIAEASSRNNLIRKLEEHLNQSQIKHMELVAGCDSKQKLVDEVRSRLVELETEVERQRVLISEGAEEKREAIRQLCFSLEHYRSGYKELRQAFIGHKRLAVLAS